MMGVWHVRMGAGAAWRKTVWGEFLSEYLGTFTLIAFGDGVVAVAVAGLNQSGRAATNHTIFLASGDWLLITFGWFVAVVLGIYVAGGISGAHINPALGGQRNRDRGRRSRTTFLPRSPAHLPPGPSSTSTTRTRSRAMSTRPTRCAGRRARSPPTASLRPSRPGTTTTRSGRSSTS